MGIRVSTELDPSGINKGASTVKRTLADVDNSASKTEKSFDNVTGSVVKMGAGMLGGALSVAALTSQLKKSISTQRTFEKSMADLSAITGATGSDLQFLNEEAKKLGSTTNFSASQVATSFKLIASAKPDLLESSDALASVTANVLLLAEASGTTLENAASTVGGALNQFAADADEAARFVNVLAAGAKLGASEVEDTAMALKNAGVAANSAGLSFEEFNATVQVLSKTTIKGSEAGTALRNIFSKLDTDIDKNVRPSVVGLSTALENLAAKNLDATEITKMFGLENKDAAQFILDNRREVDDLTTALTGTNVAAEQSAIKLNTLDGDILSLSSAVEGLYINIGENLNPSTRELTQFLTEAASKASFFYASLIDGSTSKMLSDMADLQDEISGVEKVLENTTTAWGRFKNVATFDATDTTEATNKLVKLREELAKLRGDYAKATGLTTPEPSSGGSKPSVTPIVPSNDSPLGLTADAVKNAERDAQTLVGLQQQLSVAMIENKRDQELLLATQKLSVDATPLQIQQAKDLAGALYDQKTSVTALAEAERKREQEKLEAQRSADALSGQVDQIAFGVLSPVDQIRAEEQMKLDVLDEYALLGAEQAQRAEDLKTEIARQAAVDRNELNRRENQTTLAAAASGFDALSSLASAFASGQDAENSKAFALSKAFATASAGVNLALAISQALADPTALTLPQKLANYAAIGTAGAGLISTISSANYATGGFVQGAGSGTSDSINANISNGEFVMNARATSRNRGALESLNNGGGLGGGGTNVNVNVINNTPTEVTTSVNQNGDTTIQIDERINKLVPGIIGNELNNPYSAGTKSIRSNYNIPRS